MKIREYLGGALMLLAVLLLVAMTGGDEAPLQLLAFLFSIAIFLVIAGNEIGQFGILTLSKKFTGRLLVTNYFLTMLLAPFPLPAVLQWLNTAIALVLLIYWAWPLIKKETGWGTQPVM